MESEEFFQSQSEESEVKTTIVRKYFAAWAKIIGAHLKKKVPDPRLGYVDLFAGRGRYADGSKSTPLIILDQAIRDSSLRSSLLTLFNDKEAENIKVLSKEVDSLSGIEGMNNRPLFLVGEVNSKLITTIEKYFQFPTLYFLDPWGYKGVSVEFIEKLISSWGSECIFFFNYSRINAAISNRSVDQRVNMLFGEEEAERLRASLPGKNSEERQELIIGALKDALKKRGGEFCIEYFFKNQSGKRTSHFIIHVCKNPKGYDLMKDVMARESSFHDDGVASFGFNLADKMKGFQQSLFHKSPLEELAEALLADFSGQTLAVRDLYALHSIERKYTKRNYKDALKRLEAKGEISMDPSADNRRKVKGQVTLSDSVLVSFPSKEVN